MSQVKITVVSQQGYCGFHHKVGDSWTCGGTTPAGVCASAWDTIYPTVRTLANGGAFDWAEPDGSLLMCCSDPKNPVIFRLETVK